MAKAKSFVENGNLTRGQYGEGPVLEKVVWDAEENGWRIATESDPESLQSWGAWDATFGWQAPWPDDDVVNE